MTSMEYIDSYYRYSKRESQIYPRLDRNVSVDVCVVGGGLAGLTAARELLMAGKSVVMLEAHRIGWGASGRNGGFVSDGYAEGLLALEKRVGPDHAKALFDVSKEGTGYVRKTILACEEPIAASINPVDGWLRVIRYDDEAGLQRTVDHLERTYGVTQTLWTTEQVRAQLVSERYFQGLHDPSAFHIQPLNYALALAGMIEGGGGQIFEQTPAVGLDKVGGRWQVRSKDGALVDAGAVLLCGNAYMKGLYPKVERAVLPVATYVVASELMPERLAEAIRYKGCIGDTRRAGDYYRLIEDGERLLWGGRITTRRSEPRALAQLLKRDIVSIYPQLGDFQVAFAWSGLMGYCLHKMPILREMEPGLWAATATGGHGLNSTATIGMLAAEGIAGLSDRYRLFDPFKAQWGGGLVGQVGTQFAYWGLQIQDWFEEMRA